MLRNPSIFDECWQVDNVLNFSQMKVLLRSFLFETASRSLLVETFGGLRSVSYWNIQSIFIGPNCSIFSLMIFYFNAVGSCWFNWLVGLLPVFPIEQTRVCRHNIVFILFLILEKVINLQFQGCLLLFLLWHLQRSGPWVLFVGTLMTLMVDYFW